SVNVENRFRYNQAFKSIFAMVPLTIVMVLVLIPAVMTTIAVVREKETGSIANFQSTPVSKFEFLMGKQFPYVVVGMLAFIILLLMALFVFHVPVKGSFGALGFGTLISTFTQTQVAAVFATVVLSIIPTVNFSGLITPVSSLTGGGRVMGLLFPAAWYQPISVGTFTKGLRFSDLWFNALVLAGFAVSYLIAAHILLRKQES